MGDGDVLTGSVRVVGVAAVILAMAVASGYGPAYAADRIGDGIRNENQANLCADHPEHCGSGGLERFMGDVFPWLVGGLVAFEIWHLVRTRPQRREEARRRAAMMEADRQADADRDAAVRRQEAEEEANRQRAKTWAASRQQAGPDSRAAPDAPPYEQKVDRWHAEDALRRGLDLERRLVTMDPDGREQVATDPDTPSRLLAGLADDDVTFVVQAVAANPSTPQDILRNLAGNRLGLIQCAVARNPAAPWDLLEYMADGKGIVAETAQEGLSAKERHADGAP